METWLKTSLLILGGTALGTTYLLGSLGLSWGFTMLFALGELGIGIWAINKKIEKQEQKRNKKIQKTMEKNQEKYLEEVNQKKQLCKTEEKVLVQAEELIPLKEGSMFYLPEESIKQVSNFDDSIHSLEDQCAVILNKEYRQKLQNIKTDLEFQLQDYLVETLTVNSTETSQTNSGPIYRKKR